MKEIGMRIVVSVRNVRFDHLVWLHLEINFCLPMRRCGPAVCFKSYFVRNNYTDHVITATTKATLARLGQSATPLEVRRR